jgi:hypothetical protein
MDDTIDFHPTNTPERIHLAIEKKLSVGSSYIDALVEYAHENDVEIETVAEIVKKSIIIKEKIRTEAREKRLLKKNADGAKSFFE